jgi:hypothetical protein
MCDANQIDNGAKGRQREIALRRQRKLRLKANLVKTHQNTFDHRLLPFAERVDS